MPRIVITMTTMPTRYSSLNKTLESLHRQTVAPDVIYLGIPKISRRLNTPYPELPQEILDKCTPVLLDKDYGPISKIFAGIVMETDPETIIISCDDDTIYAKDFIEKFSAAHELYPDDCLSSTGGLLRRGFDKIGLHSTIHPFDAFRGLFGIYVPRQGRYVDLLFGVAGVLYTRQMFPEFKTFRDFVKKYIESSDAVFHNDDVLISAHLKSNGFKIRVLNSLPSVKNLNAGDALSGDFDAMIGRTIKSIEYMEEQGYFSDYEYMATEDSRDVRIFLFAFALTLLVFVIIGLLIMY